MFAFRRNEKKNSFAFVAFVHSADLVATLSLFENRISVRKLIQISLEYLVRELNCSTSGPLEKSATTVVSVLRFYCDLFSPFQTHKIEKSSVSEKLYPTKTQMACYSW